jgi:formyltetrahydrofolate hydrolase
MLGKFAGFLTKSNMVSAEDIPGIICTISTTLEFSRDHEFWIVDSGATDHMTKQCFFLT